MRNVLIVTHHRAPFENATAALAGDGKLRVDWADSLQSAVAALKARRPDLLIVDQRIGERSGLDLCREVMRVDAFVNMAAVSDMEESDFHEASEGLGLIGRLPSRPTATDFEKLLALLAGISPPVTGPQD
jgi:DNA-binding NtrC family response regulator